MGCKATIKDRLRGKPHLIPVYTNVHRIPERLRERDKSIFVVFNAKSQRYEIHCLNNIGNTFAFQLPYGELDARAETYYHKTNLRTRGRAVFDEMDEHNERLSRSYERARLNEQDAYIRDEIYPRMKKAAYSM